MHGEKIRNYCIKNRPNTWKVTAHEYWTFFYIILVLRLDLLEVDALKKLSDVKLIFFSNDENSGNTFICNRYRYVFMPNKHVMLKFK
jgi:hypothetical protein